MILAGGTCKSDGTSPPDAEYRPPPGVDCGPPPFPVDRCGDRPAKECLRTCGAELELSCCVQEARCIRRDSVTGCETLMRCTSVTDGACASDGRPISCHPPNLNGVTWSNAYSMQYRGTPATPTGPCQVEGLTCQGLVCQSGTWRAR
jgi:hypothetical protein